MDVWFIDRKRHDGALRPLQSFRTLDLEAQRERYGADAPAMAADLAPRCAARIANSKRRFQLLPDPTKHSGMGQANAYAKANEGRQANPACQ